jgi:hypothetical protein
LFGFIDGFASRLPDEIIRVLKDALTPPADIGTILFSGIQPDIRDGPAPANCFDSSEFCTFRKIPGPVTTVKCPAIPAVFCRWPAITAEKPAETFSCYQPSFPGIFVVLEQIAGDADVVDRKISGVFEFPGWHSSK